MKFYSPLRYPGGKNKLTKFFSLICKKNNIDGHYVEPYAGGASVALSLLIDGYVERISINDLDRSLYAFWYSVLNDTDRLCRKIRDTEVTLKNWKKYKKTQLRKEEASLFELGFSTFFLNRTNRSGIIDGGMIGGLSQTGEYKIDCRFNKKDLIARIRLVASFKDRIHLYNLNALELLKKIQKETDTRNTIFYFDPPYYLKGPSLYMNHYAHDDHEKVAEQIKKIKNAKWVVSYDDTPEIKKIYQGCKGLDYNFYHTAYEMRMGNEVLYFSENIDIPIMAFSPVKITKNDFIVNKPLVSLTN